MSELSDEIRYISSIPAWNQEDRAREIFTLADLIADLKTKYPDDAYLELAESYYKLLKESLPKSLLNFYSRCRG